MGKRHCSQLCADRNDEVEVYSLTRNCKKASKSLCLKDQHCVWYVAKYSVTDEPTTPFATQQAYTGACYPYDSCPMWMWGAGYVDSSSLSDEYKWCGSNASIYLNTLDIPLRSAQ